MHAHTNRDTPPCLGSQKGSHPQKHRFTCSKSVHLGYA